MLNWTLLLTLVALWGSSFLFTAISVLWPITVLVLIIVPILRAYERGRDK